MLKLLRWPAVIMLLAILFTSPLAVSGLAFMTWLTGRIMVNHSTTTRLLVTGVIALAGCFFLQLTIAPFTTLTFLCFALLLTVIAARVFNPPFTRRMRKRPVHIADDDAIEVEYKVISEKIID